MQQPLQRIARLLGKESFGGKRGDVKYQAAGLRRHRAGRVLRKLQDLRLFLFFLFSPGRERYRQRARERQQPDPSHNAEEDCSTRLPPVFGTGAGDWTAAPSRYAGVVRIRHLHLSAHSGKLVRFLQVHAGTRSLSRPLFRRRCFRRIFHPLHAGRFLPGSGICLYRDGPQGIPTVRGQPVRWRRKRHRRFQIFERSAPDLVVRPPSERLPHAGGRRELPPGPQRPEALRSFVQVLHVVHLRRGQGAVRLRRRRIWISSSSGPTSSMARSIPTPRPPWNWARRP